MPESSDTPRPPAQAGPDSKSGEAIRTALERQLATGPADGTKCPPPPVPDHTLISRIGSGAYGEVWLARSALGTLRAVKVVYRARFKEDRPYEREFSGILKYEPISRTHEGLVQVLHVGRNDEAGCFYYVMELADAAEPRVESPRELRVERKAPSADVIPQLSTPPPLNYAPRTLRSDLADRQRLPPADAAKLVLRLAAALGHLHAHG